MEAGYLWGEVLDSNQLFTISVTLGNLTLVVLWASYKMWVVILTLHRILTEFKPIIAVKFPNSTWKIDNYSVSVNYYFHFSSLILHYSFYKAFLCLLLFPSYNDSSRQGLRNSKSSFEYSLWRKNVKSRPRALASGPDKCFGIQPETGSVSINCPVLQIRRTRSWVLNPFVSSFIVIDVGKIRNSGSGCLVFSTMEL